MPYQAPDAAAFQLFDGLQAVMAGALRGLQDTRVPMWIAIFSYWVPGFGLAIGLGFYTPLEGTGVWIGLATGLFFAAAITARAATTGAHVFATAIAAPQIGVSLRVFTYWVDDEPGHLVERRPPAEDLADVAAVVEAAAQRTPEQVAIVHKWADVAPPAIWNEKCWLSVNADTTPLPTPSSMS